MKMRLVSSLIGILALSIFNSRVWISKRLRHTAAKRHMEKHHGPKATPAEQAVDMMYDLCGIAGYGIHSGVHPGPKADEAAAYIRKKPLEGRPKRCSL